MKEGITTQLGLTGFGKETQAQLEEKQKAEEREKRVRVIPAGTVVYQAGLPDKIYIVDQSFYVIKKKKPQIDRGIETVTIMSDEVHVTCEVDKQFGDGKSVWNRGMQIQVDVKRLIKKK